MDFPTPDTPDEAPTQPRESAGGSPDEPLPLLKSFPAQIGHFRLIRVLGAGGNGIVYLAEDLRLGRQVALKVPRPEALGSAVLRRRFLHEAKAAAGLDHPNLVPLYESGEAGPFCWIASAYCEGPTLAAWLRARGGPVPAKEAGALLAALAAAVQHAHERGILHRDIKPANVLLFSRERPASADASALAGRSRLNDVVPKLTDFGLAKLFERDSAHGEAGEVTRSDAVLGTPMYMAPEQAQGRTADIGPATDVYALGVLLYEILAGRPPFRGGTDLETLRLVLHEDPQPPQRQRGDVPRDLEAICLKCLEKEPSRRYPSAQALADDLRRFLDGKPTLARPLGAGARAGRWARRRPAVAALLAVSACAVLALTGGGIWHTMRLADALALAERREQRLGEYLYEADMERAFRSWHNANLRQTRDLLERHRPAPGEPDRRSFAWFYLWRLSHGERLTLRGHEGDAYWVAFTPNGSLLATAGKDATVRLWTCLDGTPAGVLRGHRGEVNALAFAPDGATLATTGDDGTVRLWDVGERRERLLLDLGKGPVLGVAFAPDGRLLATSGRDGFIRFWDPQTGSALAAFPGHDRGIEALVFSPDGKRLATAGGDGTTCVWEVAARRECWFVREARVPVYAVAFSPDGKLLAAGGKNRNIRLFDASDGRPLGLLTGHESHVQALSFSPDGRSLASGGRDATVRLWDVPDRRYRGCITGHDQCVWGLAFSPDGNTLATAGTDGTGRVWDVATGADRRYVAGGTGSGSATTVAGSVGNQAWTVCVQERTITLCDLACNRARVAREGDTAWGTSPALSPRGDLLALAGKNGRLLIWDVNCAAERFALAMPNVPIESVAFSPDGLLLAAGADDGTIALWDVDGGGGTVLEGHEKDVLALAFSPDGRTLASGGWDTCARLWDVPSGLLRKVLRGHTDWVHAVAFSADGKTLATGGRDRAARLWDVATGSAGASLPGHREVVRAVAFHPDGRTLVSGGDDGAVKLWDLVTEQEVATLEGCSHPIHTLLFSRNGCNLVAAGEAPRGEVCVWRAATPDEVAAYKK